jgi:hypothetical protein
VACVVTDAEHYRRDAAVDGAEVRRAILLQDPRTLLTPAPDELLAGGAESSARTERNRPFGRVDALLIREEIAFSARGRGREADEQLQRPGPLEPRSRVA